MKTPLLSSRQVITLCHHLHGDVLMALMIDAETLKPCLLSLEIAGDGVRTAFDAMLGDDEDLHDKAQILSTMALGMLRSTCCAAAASRNLHGTQRYLLKTT